ncbi:putative AC transposase [Purpureocillium lavendulum]|uniref:AC transposase n=1 Tax=Purpureocillium lavendulum TaxID=1247861 RepID=A0AB34FA07_9HYPO|nr:putative AC transposase [Purpureocillium lavendulum]
MATVAYTATCPHRLAHLADFRVFGSPGCYDKNLGIWTVVEGDVGTDECNGLNGDDVRSLSVVDTNKGCILSFFTDENCTIGRASVLEKQCANSDGGSFKGWTIKCEPVFRLRIIPENAAASTINPETRSTPTDLKPYTCDTHETVKKWITRQFDTEKEKVKQRIQSATSRVHISCDLWASPNTLAILGVVAHYVTEDGQLQHHTLALKDIDNFAAKAILSTSPRKPSSSSRTTEKLEHDDSGNNATLKEIKAWRQKGPLGKLHNFVVFIQRSVQRSQRFQVLSRNRKLAREQRHKMEPRDGYFSKWTEADCAGDELSADDWIVLENVKSFLEKLKMTTKALELSFATLDNVLLAMDFMLAQFKRERKHTKAIQ